MPESEPGNISSLVIKSALIFIVNNPFSVAIIPKSIIITDAKKRLCGEKPGG